MSFPITFLPTLKGRPLIFLFLADSLNSCHTPRPKNTLNAGNTRGERPAPPSRPNITSEVGPIRVLVHVPRRSSVAGVTYSFRRVEDGYQILLGIFPLRNGPSVPVLRRIYRTFIGHAVFINIYRSSSGVLNGYLTVCE